MPGRWDTKNNHRDYRIARYQFVVQTDATTPNIVGVVSNFAQQLQAKRSNIQQGVQNGRVTISI